MALYQGEDIAIRISSNGDIDLTNNDFWLLVYPKGDESAKILYSKNEFEEIKNSGSYDLVIPNSTSASMQGYYTIEILIEDSEGKHSIYRQENAFYIEHSVISTSIGS